MFLHDGGIWQYMFNWSNTRRKHVPNSRWSCRKNPNPIISVYFYFFFCRQFPTRGQPGVYTCCRHVFRSLCLPPSTPSTRCPSLHVPSIFVWLFLPFSSKRLTTDNCATFLRYRVIPMKLDICQLVSSLPPTPANCSTF